MCVTPCCAVPRLLCPANLTYDPAAPAVAPTALLPVQYLKQQSQLRRQKAQQYLQEHGLPISPGSISASTTPGSTPPAAAAAAAAGTAARSQSTSAAAAARRVSRDATAAGQGSRVVLPDPATNKVASCISSILMLATAGESQISTAGTAAGALSARRVSPRLEAPVSPKSAGGADDASSAAAAAAAGAQGNCSSRSHASGQGVVCSPGPTPRSITAWGSGFGADPHWSAVAAAAEAADAVLASSKGTATAGPAAAATAAAAGGNASKGPNTAAPAATAADRKASREPPRVQPASQRDTQQSDHSSNSSSNSGAAAAAAAAAAVAAVSAAAAAAEAKAAAAAANSLMGSLLYAEQVDAAAYAASQQQQQQQQQMQAEASQLSACSHFQLSQHPSRMDGSSNPAAQLAEAWEAHHQQQQQQLSWQQQQQQQLAWQQKGPQGEDSDDSCMLPKDKRRLSLCPHPEVSSSDSAGTLDSTMYYIEGGVRDEGLGGSTDLLQQQLLEQQQQALWQEEQQRLKQQLLLEEEHRMMEVQMAGMQGKLPLHGQQQQQQQKKKGSKSKKSPQDDEVFWGLEEQLLRQQVLEHERQQLLQEQEQQQLLERQLADRQALLQHWDKEQQQLLQHYHMQQQLWEQHCRLQQQRYLAEQEAAWEEECRRQQKRRHRSNRRRYSLATSDATSTVAVSVYTDTCSRDGSPWEHHGAAPYQPQQVQHAVGLPSPLSRRGAGHA